MTEQDLIIEEPRDSAMDLHTYPPSSILPMISHSDIGISSVEVLEENMDGKQQKKGLWDVANETQRGMKSRHLTMIGMYPGTVAVVQSSEPSFAQLLVAPSALEYSWVQEACVDRAHFHIVAWGWRLSHHQVRIDMRSCWRTSLLCSYRRIRFSHDDYSVN